LPAVLIRFEQSATIIDALSWRGLDGSHLFSIQNNSGPPQGFLLSPRGRLSLQQPAAWASACGADEVIE
jgi:hypothetical protein